MKPLDASLVVLFLQHQFLDLAVEDLFTLSLELLQPSLGIGLVRKGRGGALRVRTKLSIVVSFLILLLIDHLDGFGLYFVSHAVSVDPFGEELVAQLH